MKIGFYTHKSHLEIDGLIIGYKRFWRLLIIWYRRPLGLLLIRYSFKTYWQIVLFNIKVFITAGWRGNKMTDRYHSLTVVLEKDIRDDDAQSIINAIKMVKGVLSVKPHVSDFTSLMAEDRARRDLEEKILQVIYPKMKCP